MRREGRPLVNDDRPSQVAKCEEPFGFARGAPGAPGGEFNTYRSMKLFSDLKLILNLSQAGPTEPNTLFRVLGSPPIPDWKLHARDE